MNDDTKAHVYHQLACMERAGLPAQLAFRHLTTKDPGINKQIKQLQGYLNNGHAIAESGHRAGIFGNTDYHILHAAEIGGQLELAYQRLSDYYGAKAKRLRQIKNRLYLPALMLIIALFVQPVPALLVGAIDGQVYLWLTVGRLAVLTALIHIVLRLPFWLSHGFLRFLGLKNSLYRLQCQLPVISTWVISRQINDFLHCLAMLLEAGLPCIQAFPLALETIKNPVLKSRFGPATARLAKGQALAEALAEVSEINRTTLRIILTGEQSGKLVESIRHNAGLEAEKISIEEDLLAEWLPRLFYFLVLGWMAYSLIGSRVSSL